MKKTFLEKYKNFHIIILTVLNAGVINNFFDFHYNLMVEKFDLMKFLIDLFIYLISALVSIFIVKYLIKKKKESTK